MYSKTQFGQLLEGFPRGTFEKLVDQESADKYSKGFRSWDQYIAMVYAHLSGCRSLRELESGFNVQAAHHYHLGTRPIKRATLSDANAKRSNQLFGRICQQLLSGVHRKLRRELSELLYLMDSSPLGFQGPGFDDWACAYRNRLKQGLKLHLMLEAQQGTPCFAQLTPMPVSDIKLGRQMPIEAGATYVFDKGYYDYNWWYRLNQHGAWFVTRLKKNANVSVQERHRLPDNDGRIIEDAAISLNNRYVKSHTEKNLYRHTALRRITVKREHHKTPLILVTNDFERSASEIAALYKKRWDIELFFKWIKQNLRMKHFLGRSENAVKIQIYTALISYLLLQLFQRKKGLPLSLKLCLSRLRISLFQRLQTEEIIAYREKRRRDWLRTIQPELAF